MADLANGDDTAQPRRTIESRTPESRAMVVGIERAWNILGGLNALPPGDFAAMREVLGELIGHELDASVRGSRRAQWCSRA